MCQEYNETRDTFRKEDVLVKHPHPDNANPRRGYRRSQSQGQKGHNVGVIWMWWAKEYAYWYMHTDLKSKGKGNVKFVESRTDRRTGRLQTTCPRSFNPTAWKEYTKSYPAVCYPAFISCRPRFKMLNKIVCLLFSCVIYNRLESSLHPFLANVFPKHYQA